VGRKNIVIRMNTQNPGNIMFFPVAHETQVRSDAVALLEHIDPWLAMPALSAGISLDCWSMPWAQAAAPVMARGPQK